MFNFSNLSVPLNKWLSKDVKKNGVELQAKIDELKNERQALNEQEALNHNASIYDDVDWEVLHKNYVGLLRKELALRGELAQWLEAEYVDCVDAHNKAIAKYDALKEELVSKLVAMGWGEFQPQTKGFVNLNTKVVELLHQVNAPASKTHIDANNEAIAKLETELKNLRSKKMI